MYITTILYTCKGQPIDDLCICYVAAPKVSFCSPTNISQEVFNFSKDYASLVSIINPGAGKLYNFVQGGDQGILLPGRQINVVVFFVDILWNIYLLF